MSALPLLTVALVGSLLDCSVCAVGMTGPPPTRREVFQEHTSAHGLSSEDAEALWRDFSMSIDGLRVRDRFSYWKRLDAAVPLLADLAEDERLAEDWTIQDTYELTNARAFYFLGCMLTKEATDYLIATAKARLRRGFRKEGVHGEMRALYYALAFTGSDEAIDLLLEVQSEAFWNSEDAPVVDIKESTLMTPEDETAFVRKRLMKDALLAIPHARTKRAVDIFGTGDGLNPRFRSVQDSCFRLAVREYVGVIGCPERRGIPLPRKVRKKIRAVYKEYGKEYRPEPAVKSEDSDRFSPGF